MDTKTTEFETEAPHQEEGLVNEFGRFLWHNKKWWLLPLVAILLLHALLILLAGSGAAPFIYPLF